MSDSASWPEKLAFGNIRAVPSFHLSPEFAVLVRQQIEVFKPDLVAVEFSDIYAEKIKLGVSLLPVLSAVVTQNDGIIAITPEDSMIEGVRSALENKIDLAFIDLEIAEDPEFAHEGRDLIVDAALLDHVSLVDFIGLNSDKILPETRNSAFIAREEHMAASLQRLSQKYQRILFICGMVHWDRIKKRLEGTNKAHKHSFKGPGALALMTFKAFMKSSGAIPFRASCYEKSRKDLSFNTKGWLSRLFSEAGKNVCLNLTVSDLADLLRFSRNQAIISGRIAPSLECLNSIGATVFDQSYAEAVRLKCREYEFICDKTDGQLVVDFDDGFILRSAQGVYPLKSCKFMMQQGADVEASTCDDKRMFGRNHPFHEEIRRHPRRHLSDAWGRYGDEMDEEERFIATLERWAYHEGNGEEYDCVEFFGGLIDGLDVGATIRDLVNGRMFVKEFSNEEPRFSAVLVEFSGDAKDYESLIYTYGRHKALAFTSNDRPNPQKAGTASREFGLMLSFKRLIDNERLWLMFDEMASLANAGQITPREILVKIALEYCRSEDLLVVAPEKALIDYRRIFSRYDKNSSSHFTALSREKVWNPSCERIKRFNIYYYL